MDNGALMWFLSSPWFAIVAGLLIQMYGTQKAKFWLPDVMSVVSRRRVTRLLGFFMGVIPTAAILAAIGCPGYQVMWLALLIGIAGPALYKVATSLLYRARPELEGTLSARVRVRRSKYDPAIGRESQP